MCRLLGYLGRPIQLDRLLFKPEHSLVAQSYQPQEMTAGLLNADGFGLGWYHQEKEDVPYIYKNILPIWADQNLPQIARYIETTSTVGYVRSATPGLAIDITNCQPFTREQVLFVHNGYIENFRQTLYRPIRNLLSDSDYQAIQGNTDSEHIWALIKTNWRLSGYLITALELTLQQLTELAQKYHTDFSANIILNNRDRLIVSRYSDREKSPTLYWIANSPLFPDSVIIASEPMFVGNWHAFSENSVMSVEKNLEVTCRKV